MKLSHWAKNKGIQYGTALKWFHQGKIEGAYQIDTGTILVDESLNSKKINKVFIYARVSSTNRRKEINYQIDRISSFANSNGYVIEKIYKEVASGMNDNRVQLWKMINENPTHIIIENKDRLTRFGFNYLEKLLNKLGCEVIVMNKDHEDETDLMKDLVSVITSFCCRLYGLRRGQNKANKIKEELNK
jgi:putative resolvase